MTKKKLTFRVVEVSDDERHEGKFESFKEDYLNPFSRKDELIKKYELPSRIYSEFINRIHKDTGITYKPTRRAMTNSMEYIYELKTGWGIRKQFGENRFMEYFGHYDDLDTAKFVRDKLFEANWDEELAEELISKYATVRKKKMDMNVRKKYDDFKELYMNHPLRYDEICEELGISYRGYYTLLAMLREEIPDVKKCYVRRSPKHNMRYVYRIGSDYQVVKRVGGSTRYFGKYNRLQDAINVRNRLERNNWNDCEV